MGIMYRCSLGGGGETCEFIAPDYDANKTDYAADDVVLKDGKVMKYNGSEWEDFSLAECTTLNSNLGLNLKGKKLRFIFNNYHSDSVGNPMNTIKLYFDEQLVYSSDNVYGYMKENMLLYTSGDNYLNGFNIFYVPHFDMSDGNPRITPEININGFIVIQCEAGSIYSSYDKTVTL